MTASPTTRLVIEEVALDWVHPDPANPRRISAKELEALTRSITEFGFIDPIIVGERTAVVIGGHQRLVAARKLGLKTVPVIFLDVGEEKAKLFNVALNKISGEFDEELLAQLLADLAESSGHSTSPSPDLTAKRSISSSRSRDSETSGTDRRPST